MSTRPPATLSLMLALVFPAIVGAALALAYYGYRYADNFLRSSEASLMEDNRQVAEELKKAIEVRIDEADNALFKAITLSYDAAGVATVEAPETRSAAIESFVVLDDHHGIVSPKPADKAWQQRYLQNFALAWDTLKPGSFRHLHQLYEGRSVLIAYAHQKTKDGRSYFVAAKHDLGVVQREWLPAEVKDLRGNRRLAVWDEQGSLVFGQPFSHTDDRFLYEGSFGKTLYAWRIQLAPRNVEELQTQARKRVLVGRALIPLSTAIIAIGLGFVLMAVRAERRASRLRSDFIANVSHELKTPLSLIRMFGELIATGRHRGESTAQEYAGIITRESERLSHLIDNVLDFARLERGKASYDFAEGDIVEVVERTLDVCRYRVEKEKLKLVTAIEPGLPRIRMDENAMTLLLLNLVDNAVKYGADGGEVDVALRRAPGGVALSVSDRGPGIAADEHRRIFERFYRARSARERNIRGSGIGLALVEHISRAHGGRVEVDSAPGRGAAFRVFLPAAPVVDEAPSAESLPDGLPQAGKP